MSLPKHKQSANKGQQLAPAQYIKQKARNLLWGKCYIDAEWRENGMFNIVMSRVMPSGKKIYGFYLIDMHCLGVKDAFYVFAPEMEINSAYLKREQGRDFIEIDVVLAQNIIYGAVEYAEDLGFPPAKDFAVAEYILDPADEIPYIELEFGKNGKPFYTQGPYDNPKKIINQLNKSVGAGNYLYMIRSDILDKGPSNFQLD